MIFDLLGDKYREQVGSMSEKQLIALLGPPDKRLPTGPAYKIGQSCTNIISRYKDFDMQILTIAQSNSLAVTQFKTVIAMVKVLPSNAATNVPPGAPGK